MEVDGSSTSVSAAAPAMSGQQLAARALLALGGFGLAATMLRSFGSGRINMGLELAALAAGVALYFAGPRAAAIVRWLAMAWLPTAVAFAFTQYVAPPADLTFTQVRLYPLASLATLAAAVGPCAVMYWLLRVLPKPARARGSWIPLALGILTALFWLGMMARMLGGADAQRARDMVAAEYGGGYRYYTTSLNWTKAVNGEGQTTVTATVAIWNKGQVLTVPVRWNR